MKRFMLESWEKTLTPLLDSVWPELAKDAGVAKAGEATKAWFQEVMVPMLLAARKDDIEFALIVPPLLARFIDSYVAKKQSVRTNERENNGT